MRHGRLEGSRHPVAVAAVPCRDCTDVAEFDLAGAAYCPRCALIRVVTALRAEVAVSPLQEPTDTDRSGPDRSGPVLVDH